MAKRLGESAFVALCAACPAHRPPPRSARRLELPQLLLSLDLPPLGPPGAPETGYAMLSLERGLLQVCKVLAGGA